MEARDRRYSGSMSRTSNGYRAMWAAQAKADVRTAVDTARLNGANSFQTILETRA